MFDLNNELGIDKEKIEPNFKLLKQLGKLFRRIHLNTNTQDFILSSAFDLQLFDELKIGVYVVDYSNSTYLYVNNALAELVGIEKAQFLISNIQILESIIHPDDYVKVLQIIKKAFNLLLNVFKEDWSQVTFKVFYRIKLADGKYSWCMQMNKLVQNGENEQLIDFGTVVCLPDNQSVQRVAGYFFNGNKTKELLPDSRAKDLNSTLSPRENEILMFIAKGFSSKEIGEKLDLQIQTVKIHRRNILKKLKVKSSIHAIRQWEAERGNNDSLFFN